MLTQFDIYYIAHADTIRHIFMAIGLLLALTIPTLLEAANDRIIPSKTFIRLFITSLVLTTVLFLIGILTPTGEVYLKMKITNKLVDSKTDQEKTQVFNDVMDALRDIHHLHKSIQPKE